MTKSELQDQIRNTVKQNNSKAITGTALQNVLLAMTNYSEIDDLHIYEAHPISTDVVISQSYISVMLSLDEHDTEPDFIALYNLILDNIQFDIVYSRLTVNYLLLNKSMTIVNLNKPQFILDSSDSVLHMTFDAHNAHITNNIEHSLDVDFVMFVKTW